MTKVTMFRAADGKLFDNSADCAAYERKLMIESSVWHLTNDSDLFIPLEDPHSGSALALPSRNVGEFISKNADELLKLLVATSKKRRGRKAKVEGDEAAAA